MWDKGGPSLCVAMDLMTFVVVFENQFVINLYEDFPKKGS